MFSNSGLWPGGVSLSIVCPIPEPRYDYGNSGNPVDRKDGGDFHWPNLVYHFKA